MHGKAVSNDKKEQQKNIAQQIMHEQLRALELDLSEEYFDIHNNLLSVRKQYDLKIKTWIKKIIAHNKTYKIYNQKKLKRTLWNKWVQISYFALSKEKNIFKILKIMSEIPVMYYIDFVKFMLKRKRG